MNGAEKNQNYLREAEKMEEKVFDELTYLVSYPEGFREDQKYPLVVFLHGAGSRGETTELLRKNVSLKLLRKHQDERGYLLLAPLCNGVTWDEWMQTLVRLVEAFRELPYVDVARVHLTGNSMGGYGTWQLSVLRASWFASAMPLCGGGFPGFAKRLAELPIRAFHGLQDKTVNPTESLEMAKAVNLSGGHVELILFPELGHNCWEKVYSDERNYDWLLAFTTERDRELAEKLSLN